MADYIFYHIDRVTDCDCYQSNDIEIGDCPELPIDYCICSLGNEAETTVDGYVVNYTPPSGVTTYLPDLITPDGLLFNNGTIEINLDITSDFFSAGGFACVLDSMTVANIISIDRVPVGYSVLDTANLVNIYPANPASPLLYVYPNATITISGVVAEYIDAYTAASRYLITLQDQKGCFHKLFINQQLGYVIQGNNTEGVAEEPSLDAEYLCTIGDEYFNAVIQIRNYTGGDDGLTNGLTIPAGTIFTIEVPPSLAVAIPVDLDYAVLYDGDTASNAVPVGPLGKVNVGPITAMPSTNYGFTIEILSDWLPLDEMQITLVNEVVDCPALPSTIDATFTFPGTFEPTTKIITLTDVT